MSENPDAPGEAHSQSRPPSVVGKFSFLFPALIVAVVGAVFYFSGRNQSVDQVAPKGDNAKPQVTKQVEVGQDYYVMVRLIELPPKSPFNNRPWDAGRAKSAPDIYFELSWQDNVIFSTKDKEVRNTLIAEWSGLKLPMAEAVERIKRNVPLVGGLMRKGQATDDVLNAFINARRISVRKGENLTVAVFDKDGLFGGRDDRAGCLNLLTTDLVLGDKTYTEGGFVRLILRTVPADLPPAELVEQLY